MNLRLIQLFVPPGARTPMEQAVDGRAVLASWSQDLGDGETLACFLVDAGAAEALLDALQERLGALEGFLVLVLPVEAALPRPSDAEPGEEAGTGGRAPPGDGGIGREELYQDLAATVEFSGPLVAQVLLSAVVAAVGLLRGDTAILIGAMVIAPLLGPNIALGLGTTLGDLTLIRRALLCSAVGLFVALVPSVAIGAYLSPSPELPALVLRSTLSIGDVVLALAAGSAGTLAFTTGAPASLVGVMVAVALLPVLVAGGLLLGAGHVGPAASAGRLLAVNIVSVNLAAVVTFLLEGIRPRTWWEGERARKAVRTALLLWSLLLAGLIALILTAPRISPNP